ncbi:MAG: hypothetical protein INR71_08035 [Terriglobus roseus]|nr:hypothetical protein [Terriglobus roseus]
MQLLAFALSAALLAAPLAGAAVAKLPSDCTPSEQKCSRVADKDAVYFCLAFGGAPQWVPVNTCAGECHCHDSSSCTCL